MDNDNKIRPIDLIFGGRREAIATEKCSWCFEAVGPFKDKLSEKEYHISGFCQSCQDKTFGSEASDNE